MSWSLVIRSLVAFAVLMVIIGCAGSVWLVRRFGANAWQRVEVVNRTEAAIDVAGIYRVPNSDFGVIPPGKSATKQLRIGDMSPGFVRLVLRRPDGSLVSKQTDYWVDDDELRGDSLWPIVITSIAP